jgi:hypothetical protein
MIDGKDSHVDEGQILISLVDDADLTAEARAHLAVCPECQGARQRHADQLQRLAELAQRGVPAPLRRVTLPRELGPAPGKARHQSWSLQWKPALALAAVAMVVMVLVTLWWQPAQERQLVRLEQEWQDDRILIAEVRRLETDALPSLYGSIAGEDDFDSDEDTWDLMVPGADEETLSDQGSPGVDGQPVKTIISASPPGGPHVIWLRWQAWRLASVERTG